VAASVQVFQVEYCIEKAHKKASCNETAGFPSDKQQQQQQEREQTHSLCF